MFVTFYVKDGQIAVNLLISNDETGLHTGLEAVLMNGIFSTNILYKQRLIFALAKAF